MNDELNYFINYIQSVKRYSEHTCLAYESDIKSFIHFVNETFDVQFFSEVKSMHTRTFIVQLKESGVKNVSINRKISALNQLFLYLKKKKLVESNPMSKVRSFRLSKRTPSFVPEAKIDRVTEKEISDRPFAAARDHLIMSILYSTGMRRSELINIKLQDVDVSNKTIKVLGKGKKERLCPITNELVDAIEHYNSLRMELFPNGSEPYLLLTEKGKKCYPKLIYNIVRRNLEKYNASDKKSPHVLRHTFATHLSSRGADLMAIKELLGHANLSATQIYTHNNIDRLLKEFSKAHPRS